MPFLSKDDDHSDEFMQFVESWNDDSTPDADPEPTESEDESPDSAGTELTDQEVEALHNFINRIEDLEHREFAIELERGERLLSLFNMDALWMNDPEFPAKLDPKLNSYGAKIAAFKKFVEYQLVSIISGDEAWRLIQQAKLAARVRRADLESRKQTALRRFRSEEDVD